MTKNKIERLKMTEFGLEPGLIFRNSSFVFEKSG